MFLSPEEINSLEELSIVSNQTWFQIKTPTFIWDSDNHVRLSVIGGCTELLQCSENCIEALSARQKKIIKNLKK